MATSMAEDALFTALAKGLASFLAFTNAGERLNGNDPAPETKVSKVNSPDKPASITARVSASFKRFAMLCVVL
jgi:hypothetical protein